MGHSPGHHIEHAEHAAHASHDNFDKRVTMSIAIVAAVLACVTMLGHRAHNETLIIQGEALEAQTRASKLSADRANDWAYYQSKNTFNFLAELQLDILSIAVVREDRMKEYADIVKRYEETVESYSGHKDNRYAGKNRKVMKDGYGNPTKGKLVKLEETARKSEQEIAKLEQEAEAKLKEHHLVHAKAIRIDLGELGLQFGVVLCSLAILTKSRGFWFVGLLSAAIGLAVALTGQFGVLLPHH
jgi:hypothetical protein